MEDYLTITLFGQTYTFKFESDHLNGKEIVDVLTGEIKRLESQHDQPIHLDKYVILILAALNISQANIVLKSDYRHQLSVINDRLAKLIRRIDNRIDLHSDSVSH